MGTKQDLYYLKGTFIFNNQNFFTYPASFDSAPYQPGSRARNSDNQTLSGNIIGGWTPNDDVDVMVGYTRQHFQKGQPFDAAQTRTATQPPILTSAFGNGRNTKPAVCTPMAISISAARRT